MMKKIIISAIVIPPLLFAAFFGYLLVTAPRMTVQQHVRDFQMIMPGRPAGTATVVPPDTLPSAAEAASLKSTLQANAENLTRARVYYHYYCVFCHGDSGAGDGPAGQSYAPKPADLRSQKIAGYGDGQLLRSMLTGIGHEPVLARIVPPEHRWYLVLFVRSLPKAR